MVVETSAQLQLAALVIDANLEPVHACFRPPLPQRRRRAAVLDRLDQPIHVLDGHPRQRPQERRHPGVLADLDRDQGLAFLDARVDEVGNLGADPLALPGSGGDEDEPDVALLQPAVDRGHEVISAADLLLVDPGVDAPCPELLGEREHGGLVHRAVRAEDAASCASFPHPWGLLAPCGETHSPRTSSYRSGTEPGSAPTPKGVDPGRVPIDAVRSPDCPCRLASVRRGGGATRARQLAADHSRQVRLLPSAPNQASTRET